jgi:hypothetical protein
MLIFKHTLIIQDQYDTVSILKLASGRVRYGHYKSDEDYLKQILILLETKGYARSVDISEALGITKPSVSVKYLSLYMNHPYSGYSQNRS